MKGKKRSELPSLVEIERWFQLRYDVSDSEMSTVAHSGYDVAYFIMQFLQDQLTKEEQQDESRSQKR